MALLAFGLAKAQPEAHIQFTSFYTTDQGPYMETAFVVIGSSLTHLPNENGKLQSKILVTEIFKQDDEILDFKKYELFGPEVTDSLWLDFMNQERFAMPSGFYQYEIAIVDLYSPDSAQYTYNTVAHMLDEPGEEITSSTLELIESSPVPTVEQTKYSKSGYEIKPLVYDYFPPAANELSFYLEIYNSDVALGADNEYLATYHIENYSNGEIVGQYRQFDKLSTAPVNVLIKGFNITELETGTYILVLEVRDKENELLMTKQHRFFRFNADPESIIADINEQDIFGTFAEKITDWDTLAEHLYSMHPIAEGLERNIIDNQIPTFDVETMQQFLYTFWSARDAEDPEAAFLTYTEQVALVNEAYGTKVRKGYETDRGRVYLQYGTPDSQVLRPSEPSSYPYEIWHYHRAGEYTNRRFVFYNPDLVTNDYTLLHSDMYGEIKNNNWELILNSRNNPLENIDQTDPRDQYGGNADDFFTNPR